MTGHDTLFIGGEWVSAQLRRQDRRAQRVHGRADRRDARGGRSRRGRRGRRGAPRVRRPVRLVALEPARRGEALERLAAELEQRAQDIGRLVSQQNGMPFALSPLIEGMTPVGTLRYMVSLLACAPPWRRRPPGSSAAT